jgi:hypothetical protein
MLFKGVGYDFFMETEEEWLTELKLEVDDRLKKKDLCARLEIEWSEDFCSIPFERFVEEAKTRIEIAKKYGQVLQAEHFKKSLDVLDHYLSNVAVRNKTLMGKYSLTEASSVFNIPCFYLKVMCREGIISYEEIGRARYVEAKRFRKELESPQVKEFIEKRREKTARTHRGRRS